MLSSRSDMVLCGVDRLLGNEGKPVVLIATLGFHGNILTGQSSELAPTEVSEVLPTEMRKDTQAIADKFSHIREAQLNEFRDGLHPYFRTDIIKLSL